MTDSPQPPASALTSKILTWVKVETAVVMLIGLIGTTPEVLPAFLTVAVVVHALILPALASVVLMLACVVALAWWARSPGREVLVRTGCVMGATCLLLGAGLYGIDHTIGTLRLILSVLYFGFGGFAILFVQEVIPRWEARGYLRHPQVPSSTRGMGSPATLGAPSDGIPESVHVGDVPQHELTTS